jgi:hypothetical protein
VIAMQMMLFLLAAVPVQDDLSAMMRADGARYVEARNRMMERASAAQIEERRRASRYDAATWRDDVIADAAYFWLTRKADAERVYSLEGLRPDKYGQRRRPEPEAARELIRVDAAPIAFEILLKTRALYAVRTENERVALEEALVLALGVSSHPAAAHALRAIAQGDAERIELRELAVSRLTSEAELVSLLSHPVLRTGAVLGLGQLRTRGSIAALKKAASDPALRLTAIRSLAQAASPFVLRRTKNPQAEAIRAEAIAALQAIETSDEIEARARTESLSIVQGRTSRAVAR